MGRYVTRNGFATSVLAKMAEKAYAKKPGGADAVYDLANKHGVTKYGYCKSCDTRVPMTFNGSCLVCSDRTVKLTAPGLTDVKLTLHDDGSVAIEREERPGRAFLGLRSTDPVAVRLQMYDHVFAQLATLVNLEDGLAEGGDGIEPEDWQAARDLVAEHYRRMK